MKKIRDIMSAYVETVTAGATVMEAAGRMRAFDVGVLPVVEGARLVGLITDRDIALRVAALGSSGRFIEVREVMSQEAVSCRPEDTVAEAARLMEAHRVTRLPVLDASARLLGMVVLGDLARSGHEELAGRVMAGMIQLVPMDPIAPEP